MKRRLTLAAVLAAITTAGLLTALVVAPSASAWSPDNLPPGFTSETHISVGWTAPSDIAGPCPQWDTISGAGATSPDLCRNSPTYQQDFDAFVDAHYTPPPSTTAATSDPGQPTTVVITTTTPAATTTAPTDTATQTTAQGAPAPAPAPAPPVATTNIVTVVTTATPLEQSLQAQIDALAAKLAALSDRVGRVEKAGDAAWLAFEQAVAGGADPAAAADSARGTYLNVVNQLGAFAPAG